MKAWLDRTEIARSKMDAKKMFFVDLLFIFSFGGKEWRQMRFIFRKLLKIRRMKTDYMLNP